MALRIIPMLAIDFELDRTVSSELVKQNLIALKKNVDGMRFAWPRFDWP